MQIIFLQKKGFKGADVVRWEGVTMEFMSHAVFARFRGSLTCVGPFRTGLSQSGFVTFFQMLQVYHKKTGGAVDILEDLWAIASAADPTGSPRIDAYGICACSEAMEI